MRKPIDAHTIIKRSVKSDEKSWGYLHLLDVFNAGKEYGIWELHQKNVEEPQPLTKWNNNIVTQKEYERRKNE